jgi:sarcosine oxidase
MSLRRRTYATGSPNEHNAVVRRSADVIVVGLGAMGSAAADTLAGRGLDVIGIEAGSPGHANGSSHGATRIVRRVIEEAPFYVPLAADAIDRWDAISADTGTELLVRSGVLRVALPGSELLTAFRTSAAAHGLAYDELAAADVMERFPAFHVSDQFEAVFEEDAGFVYAARAVATLQARARRRGAELRFDEPVLGWRADHAGVAVTTAHGVHAAERLVITAGAWTGRLAAELCLPLVAHRIVNVSFEPADRELHGAGRMPAFLVDDGAAEGLPGTPALRGGMYGVPAVPGEGVKVGTSGAPTDPDRVDRVVTEDEIGLLRAGVARFLPGAAGPVAATLTCLYTKTPDEHFLIDRHPEHGNVVLASPCSGHGFKYTPAIGAALADLATGATPSHDLTPFAVKRFT